MTHDDIEQRIAEIRTRLRGYRRKHESMSFTGDDEADALADLRFLLEQLAEARKDSARVPHPLPAEEQLPTFDMPTDKTVGEWVRDLSVEALRSINLDTRDQMRRRFRLERLAVKLPTLVARLNDVHDYATALRTANATAYAAVVDLRAENESLRSRLSEARKDSARIDALEASGKEPEPRCVHLNYQPKIGLMATSIWRLHLAGVGYVARRATLREAIDAAKEQRHA